MNELTRIQHLTKYRLTGADFKNSKLKKYLDRLVAILTQPGDPL